MIRNAGDRTPAASAWTETARLVRETLRRRRPKRGGPSASTTSEPLRTAICPSLNDTWSALAPTSQSVTASATPTVPATAPASKPISATHGAKAIAPSVADHENASIRPHVAAIAATATNVTKWRR